MQIETNRRFVWFYRDRLKPKGNEMTVYYFVIGLISIVGGYFLALKIKAWAKKTTKSLSKDQDTQDIFKTEKKKTLMWRLLTGK